MPRIDLMQSSGPEQVTLQRHAISITAGQVHNGVGSGFQHDGGAGKRRNLHLVFPTVAQLYSVGDRRERSRVFHQRPLVRTSQRYFSGDNKRLLTKGGMKRHQLSKIPDFVGAVSRLAASSVNAGAYSARQQGICKTGHEVRHDQNS